MGITRIPSQVPYNKYTFSDVPGGSSDPLNSPDPDALISQDLEGEPWESHSRIFNIRGRKGSVRHLVRLILSLHDEHEYLREPDHFTGVFINHQEDGRLKDQENGHPFYVVETDKNVRFVASPLDDLRNIDIGGLESVSRVSDPNNLWGATEQFRSKYAPLLLARDHRHEADLQKNCFLGFGGEPDDLKVTYVDAFGNLLLWREWLEGSGNDKVSHFIGLEPDPNVWNQLQERVGETIGVQIGQVQRQVHVATSLRDAKPGALNIYPNGGNIDLIWKWESGCSEEERERQSAYTQFGRPVEGVSSVQLQW